MGDEPQCQGLHPLAFQRATAPTLVLVFPPSHFLLELCLSTVFLSTSDHDQQQNSGVYITTVSGFGLWLLHMCEVRFLNRWGKNSCFKLSLDVCPHASAGAVPQPKCSSGTMSLDTPSLVGSSPNRRDSALGNGMSGEHFSALCSLGIFIAKYPYGSLGRKYLRYWDIFLLPQDINSTNELLSKTLWSD